jgi:hypothetical protein
MPANLARWLDVFVAVGVVASAGAVVTRRVMPCSDAARGRPTRRLALRGRLTLGGRQRRHGPP